MSQLKFFPAIGLLPIAIGIVLSIFACKDDGKPLEIRLTDGPDDYLSVNVDIQSIKIQVDGDTSNWIDVPTNAGIYDLLKLQNGVDTVLAVGTTNASKLKKVRFVLGPNNTIVLKNNGGTFPLEAPSAEESGLKISVEKDLGTTLNTFTFDFQVDKSILEIGNGTYKLKPVIKLK